MTYRLYIDEVGNEDMKPPESERFLSLTGIVTRVQHHDHLITPEIEKLKTDLFGHDPIKNPVILHRREIVRKEKPFDVLWDPKVNAQWEPRILGLIRTLPYIAITVMIDKIEHWNKYHVWHFNPYHYCLTALVERYVRCLESHNLVGDVVAEPRSPPVDDKLKAAFRYIYANGTANILPSVIQKHLTSRELKFGPKDNNVCGLQLVDMIAHPSHHNARQGFPNQPPMKAAFGLRIVDILKKDRYRRNPWNGIIMGWGIKRLP
jgi:hypothetical protein